MKSSQQYNLLRKKAISYLRAAQNEDGSFSSYSTSKPKDFSKTKRYKTTFFTSLILRSLSNNTSDEELLPIKEKAAEFLVSERGENWAFNYWSKKSDQYKKMPYPDDLDDTFCALSALAKYDKNIIDGKVLAKVAGALTAQEERVGGPYRTWLVPKTSPKVWLDVDLAVNSNIGYFLSFFNISLESIDKLIEDALERKEITSAYYPSTLPIIYFMSFFYKGKQKLKLIDFLARIKKTNIQDIALSATALVNLGQKKLISQQLIDQLLRAVKFQPYPFCYDPSINKTKFYAGSGALTCALILEALEVYHSHPDIDLLTKKNNPIYSQIVSSINLEISQLDEPLQTATRRFANKMFSYDRNLEILLMPYFFVQDFQIKISRPKLIKLCKANFYGWLAYTIYDKLLDGENIPELISTANWALRRLTKIYFSHDFSSKEQKIFSIKMEKIDQANLWEVQNCSLARKNDFVLVKKLPDFDDLSRLAYKSWGHAMGPLVCVAAVGHKTNSQKYILARKMLQNYLVARQLNDDAHDWEEDLRAGKVTPVVAGIIRRAKMKKLITNQINFDQIEQLKELYWYEEIIPVAEKIIELINESESVLAQLNVEQRYLFELFQFQKKSAQKVLEEQKRMVQFIQNYQ